MRSPRPEKGTTMTANRWVKPDRRYKSGYRWTPYAYRALFKWTFLLFAWVIINSIVTVAHAAYLVLLTTGGMIWYAIHRFRVNHPPSQLNRSPLQVTPGTVQSAVPLRFNAPPGWPTPPAGWAPQPGWQPDPAWAPAPAGWQFWVPDVHAPVGQRNSRSIPQDVKIAVSARDGGKCRQCGSTQELHFDHVIPWSKGGANTVANIQLLCGPCNRRKGADDIPAY
jgi:HNH endonuclease